MRPHAAASRRHAARDVLLGTWTGTGSTAKGAQEMTLQIDTVNQLDPKVGKYDFHEVETAFEVRGTTTFHGCSPDGKPVPVTGVFSHDFNGSQDILIVKIEGCADNLADGLTGIVDGSS